MSAVSRKTSMVRKAPPADPIKDTIPLPASNVTQSNEPSSPVDKLRFSNPNLQPLSENEIKEIHKKSYRHSTQGFITPPDSALSSSSFKSSDSEPNSARYSTSSLSELKSRLTIRRPFTKPTSGSSALSQNFWKYHILLLGDQLYLTTNPDSKHLYCRNAPGIHVEIKYPQNNTKGIKDNTGNLGFQLIFRDQIDEEVFMTVTKKPLKDGGDIFVEALKKFYEEKEDGLIHSKDDEHLPGQFLRAQKTDISELKHRIVDSIALVNLSRYKLKDPLGSEWNVGSIPSFKSTTSTKLKNKRFVYFHEPKTNKILGCFRPCEQRVKKRIIKNLKSTAKSYIEEDTPQARILDNDSVFYSPGDGVFQQNPPDDSPSHEKLGWITIYDDPTHLGNPGVWEMVVGYTLAVGISSILRERLHSQEGSVQHRT